MMKNMDQKEGRGTWYIFFYQAIFSSNCLEDVILQYCLLSIPQASMAEEQRDWETKENLNIEKEGYRFKRKWCGLHSYPCRIIFQSHLFISACTDRHVTYVLWTASEKILLTQPILPTSVTLLVPGGKSEGPRWMGIINIYIWLPLNQPGKPQQCCLHTPHGVTCW